MTVVQLRDSTKDMYNDTFIGAGVCPETKKSAKPVVHTLPSRSSREDGRSAHCLSPSQIVPRCRHQSTTLILMSHWHRDAEAAVTSPFSNDVATMFSTHLNQALRFPRAPVDL